MMIYKHSVVGGTFDNLHKGHKHLLEETFKSSKNVTIGLTSDNFLANKKIGGIVENYKTREKNLEDFLKDKQLLKRANIVKINDIYGITLDEKEIDAIFVTDDTIENAKEINREREKLGFPFLEIVKVDLIEDERNKTVSSTNIRVGEIDNFGKYYSSLFKRSQIFKLKGEYRDKLKEPIGKVVQEINPNEFKDKFIIAVGDIAVYKLIEIKQTPNLSIYDLKTRREKIDKEIIVKLPKPDLILENPQGTIRSDTALKMHDEIRNSIQTNKKIAIKILGEEDLLAIPAILFAPIGSIVFYGIRNIGGIIITVNLNLKKEVEKMLLSYFKQEQN